MRKLALVVATAATVAVTALANLCVAVEPVDDGLSFGVNVAVVVNNLVQVYPAQVIVLCENEPHAFSSIVLHGLAGILERVPRVGVGRAGALVIVRIIWPLVGLPDHPPL